MSQVAIITDTLTEMPVEMADEYNIRLIPMLITLDDKSYPETEIDKDWYYSQVPQWKASGKMPLTSSIPTGIFLEVFREASKKADDILYIGHSSKFGMSVKSAAQAMEMLKTELPQTRIEVIDSSTVAGAQMLVVVEAARAAAAAKSLSELVDLSNAMMEKINYIVLIDDLSILAKGGRIHKACSWADTAITNTSLLEASFATGGQMTPLARCKTRPQAARKLFDIISERSHGKKLHVAINYTKFIDQAQEMKSLIEQKFQCAEVFLSTLYPLVVNHVGLEPVHVSWWCED